MGKISRIKMLKTLSMILRITGYTIIAIGVVLLVFNLVSNIENFVALQKLPGDSAIRAFTEILLNILFTPVILIVLGDIINLAYRLSEKRIAEEYNDLVKEVLGAVMMYRDISLSDLAKKIGETPTELEAFLAKLRFDKAVHVYIDSKGVIHAESAEKSQPQSPQPIPAQPVPPILHTGQEPIPPLRPQTETDTVRESERTEVVAPTPLTPQSTAKTTVDEETSEKIARLKEAYEKGLISEETYKKLLEELGRRKS